MVTDTSSSVGHLWFELLLVSTSLPCVDAVEFVLGTQSRVHDGKTDHHAQSQDHQVPAPLWRWCVVTMRVMLPPGDQRRITLVLRR